MNNAGRQASDSSLLEAGGEGVAQEQEGQAAGKREGLLKRIKRALKPSSSGKAKPFTSSSSMTVSGEASPLRSPTTAAGLSPIIPSPLLQTLNLRFALTCQPRLGHRLLAHTPPV